MRKYKLKSQNDAYARLLLKVQRMRGTEMSRRELDRELLWMKAVIREHKL